MARQKSNRAVPPKAAAAEVKRAVTEELPAAGEPAQPDDAVAPDAGVVETTGDEASAEGCRRWFVRSKRRAGRWRCGFFIPQEGVVLETLDELELRMMRSDRELVVVEHSGIMPADLGIG